MANDEHVALLKQGVAASTTHQSITFLFFKDNLLG